MARFTPGSLTAKAALIGALLLGGCGMLPEQIDETAGWNAQTLYSEAKASMSEGGYDRAIQLFEKLEARYPYGRFAQQAQLEVAYAYYKQGEQALALAAADRFIKLARSVQLLGARCIVAGVQPAVAQTLVQLGTDFGVLETYRNLKSALVSCLRRNAAVHAAAQT